MVLVRSHGAAATFVTVFEPLGPENGLSAVQLVPAAAGQPLQLSLARAGATERIAIGNAVAPIP
jgi:hypothetical protein